MEWPRLSVVIPNYNHGAYLPNCLNAVFRQAVPLLEVVVVDDGSTDNSLEVIERFAREHPIIRVIRHEKNLGAVAAAVRGMEEARGDYIFFASADDEVFPGFLEASLRLLAQHPQAALSCTASEWHDVDSGLRWHMGAGMAARPCYLSPDDLVRLGRRGKLGICSASAVMKKGPLFETGGFSTLLRWHADWFLTVTPAFRYGVCYVPEPLSKVHLHSTSYYHRGRKSADHLQVLDNLLARLSSPECADVAGRIRDSTALSLFGWPILRVMMRRPEYRQFLTPLLILWCCRRNLELVGQKILPRPLARLVLRLFYHQTSTLAQNKTP